MNSIPFYVYAFFLLALGATLYLFYKATRKSKGFLILSSIWLALQSVVGVLGFYTVTNTMPRFPLLLLPPLVFIAVQFGTKKGRQFIDSLDLKFLTIVQVVRIPVELVLYWLFLSKAVPELITFEGKNFDVIAGMTAPIIFYFAFARQKINRTILIAWNVFCLVLLLNVIFYAVLSLPTALQQFSFEQPAIAILYFPFILLPACIVPIALFSHLASLRQLSLNKSFVSKPS